MHTISKYDLEMEPAHAVEVLPVQWCYADGIAHVEVIGGTVRFVLYVTDVAGGDAERQKRVSFKLVFPIDGVIEGLQKTLAALVRPIGLIAAAATGGAFH